MEQTVSVRRNSWWQDAVTKGLILGVIHIFVFIVLYYFFPNKLTALSYVAFSILLNLIYCFVSAKQYRTQLGGYIDFGNAFKYGLLLLVANGVVQLLANLLFLLFEPSFPEVMAQSQLDTSLYWAQKFGAPDESLEKINDEFDPEEMASKYTISGQIFGFALALLFYAFGALIVGLFVRKREPEQF